MTRFYSILDPFQIIGFLISIMISIGMILSGQDTIQSVSLGLVLGILTQLFDLQLRLTRSEERNLEASMLDKKLYQNELLLEQIKGIVDDYLNVKSGWFELFKRRADDSISECRSLLHSMSEGHMYAKAKTPYTFNADEIKKAKKSVKSVTLAINVFYWRNTFARKLVDAYTFLLSKGVKCNFVYLIPRETILDAVDILEEQKQMGIDVYVAFPDEVPIDLIDDYQIMDDIVFSRLEFSDNQIKGQRISIDPIEVGQQIKNFNILMRHTQKLEDVMKDLNR